MERYTLWERLRRVNPLLGDGLLALLVFLVSVLTGSSYFSGLGRVEIRFFAGSDQDPAYLIFSNDGVQAHLGEGWPALALIAAACAPLVWRRRAPILTLALTSAAAIAYQLLGYADGLVGFPLVVAAYTAAAHRNRTVVLAAALPLTLAAALSILLVGSGDRGSLEAVAILLLLVGLPILFGRIAYNRRRRSRRDLERAASDAVGSERARIARELHDVVAHAMGVMVVQAGAGRVTIERDPAEAAAAFQRIEETGRTGLAEMRRLVGILQREEEAAALVPQPGLDQLDELFDRMRETGLPVEAEVELAPGSLPLGVDLTAYRVVQEALTNALKHGGGARARVTLRFDDHALEVEVSDDGRGPPPDGSRTQGHGLIGMRERVALFGGTLETGERPGGGFVVRARIPLVEPT